MASSAVLRQSLLGVAAFAALVWPLAASATTASAVDPTPTNGSVGRQVGTVDQPGAPEVLAGETPAPTAPADSGAANPDPISSDPAVEPTAPTVETPAPTDGESGVPSEPGADTTMPATSPAEQTSAPIIEQTQPGDEPAPADDTDGYIIWSPEHTFAGEGTPSSTDKTGGGALNVDSEGVGAVPSASPQSNLGETGATGALSGAAGAAVLLASGALLMLARRLRAERA